MYVEIDLYPTVFEGAYNLLHISQALKAFSGPCAWVIGAISSPSWGGGAKRPCEQFFHVPQQWHLSEGEEETPTACPGIKQGQEVQQNNGALSVPSPHEKGSYLPPEWPTFQTKVCSHWGRFKENI